MRAPVAGRVGKLEITVGNLVAAGPGAPVLTTLVSVNPIYASFNADEEVVTRALQRLADRDARGIGADRAHPGADGTASQQGSAIHGQLQLIDNQVDARSGTVRVRAVFDNPDGRLMPGQFVRLRMAAAKAAAAAGVNERAIGTDQNKKFVMVVDDDNKAAYREVTLGAFDRRPARRHQRARGRRAHRRQRPAARAPRRAGRARGGRDGPRRLQPRWRSAANPIPMPGESTGQHRKATRVNQCGRSRSTAPGPMRSTART